MLPINRIREYQVEIKNLLFDQQNNPLFGYCAMVVDDSQLSKILKERVASDNTFLISVVPDHYLKGSEDAARFHNALTFFILDKTDYSEHDHDSFIDIFSTTQTKALALVRHILKDKNNQTGNFCGFLNWLDENSINIVPVWAKDGCNGWKLDFNLQTSI